MPGSSGSPPSFARSASGIFDAECKSRSGRSANLSNADKPGSGSDGSRASSLTAAASRLHTHSKRTSFRRPIPQPAAQDARSDVQPQPERSLAAALTDPRFALGYLAQKARSDVPALAVPLGPGPAVVLAGGSRTLRQSVAGRVSARSSARLESASTELHQAASPATMRPALGSGAANRWASVA